MSKRPKYFYPPLLLLYASFVAYLSLYPFRWRDEPWNFSLAAIHWQAPFTRGDWMDVVANVICYLPFGALAATANRPLLSGTLYATLFSFLIELLQTAASSRDPSWRDVLCNGFGGALGALAYSLLRHNPRIFFAFKPHPALALAIVCWVCWLTFPFMLMLRLGQLRVALAPFLSIPTPDACVEFFLGAIVITAFLRAYAAPPWLQLATFACIPARLIIFSLNLPAWMIATALAAYLAARRPFSQPLNRRASLLTGLLLSCWILYSQLQPFHFASAARPFSLLPFIPLIEVSHGAALPVLGRKLLLYAGCLWALKSGSIPLRITTPLLATVLLVTELLQAYLPGRTPETTDPLLALAAGLFFAIYSRPTHLLD